MSQKQLAVLLPFRVRLGAYDLLRKHSIKLITFVLEAFLRLG